MTHMPGAPESYPAPQYAGQPPAYYPAPQYAGQPPAYYPAPPMAGQPQPSRKRRVFMWIFLAIQILFLIWVIGGAAAGHNSGQSGCGTLDAQTCQSAADAGTAIGVGIVIAFWVAVDMILGISYGIYRLATRPKTVVYMQHMPGA
jgi:hypothetical protein